MQADWSIRADERWLKGYLRLATAQTALGKYADAITTLRTGRGFALPKVSASSQLWER